MFNFIHNLFRPQAAAPAAWHAVVLSPAQAKRHARWVAQRVYLNWLAPYFKAYHLRKGGAAGTRGFQVQLVHEQGSQGVLLLYHASIGPGNFRHFFEHLGERLVDLGYHRACADKLATQHEHHTETTLKQFFKPNPTDCPKTGHCNQRFGLVTIDLVDVDGQPVFMRIASNAVLEPWFTPAGSFDELLKALLDAPPPNATTEALIPVYHSTF